MLLRTLPKPSLCSCFDVQYNPKYPVSVCPLRLVSLVLSLCRCLCLSASPHFVVPPPSLSVNTKLRTKFFNVPDNVVRGLSPECMDFMMSFVCESSARLGRRNVDEIKSHPWFAHLVRRRRGRRGGGMY